MTAFLLFLALVALTAPPEDLPGSWLQRFQLAEKAQEEGSLDEAIAYLQSCFELAPKNATAAYHLACAHARAGRADQALSWLERAVDWGWGDAEVMSWDEDLTSLRGTANFDGLLKRALASEMASEPDIQAAEPVDWELVDRERISGDEDLTRPHDVRGVENSLLRIKLPRVLPDDATAVVPASDGTIRGFDLETGGTVWILAGHTKEVLGVAVAPGGASMASWSRDGTVRLWDLRKRKETAVLEYPKLRVEGHAALEWDPQGQRVAVFGKLSSSYAIRDPFCSIRSAMTGEPLIEIPVHNGIRDLSWSPDGALLAIAHEDGYARLWNASNAAPHGLPLRHYNFVKSIAFDPTGKMLATGGYLADWDKEIPCVRIWDTASGELLQELPLFVPDLFAWDHFVGYLEWTCKVGLVATTSPFAVVQCFDGTALNFRWVSTSLKGCCDLTTSAPTNAAGNRLYVSGVQALDTMVLDASTGRELFRLNANRDRPFCNLTPTSEDRLFIATIGEIYEATGTAVFDGRTYKQRYRRFELSGGRLLLMAPVGICRCDITALRDVYMKREGDQVHPLDSFAPFLYDPKRFFAAAEGIAVRRPHLPTPPELTVVSPKGRVVSVKDDGPAIEVHASGEGGILGFQIEKDGKVLPFESVGHVEHEPDGSATLAWTIDRPHSPQTNLRIRAIGRNGVLSLPALITLDWQ